jgi:hypothetical protein
MCSCVSCTTGQTSLLTIGALTQCHILSFRYDILQQLCKISPQWKFFGRLVAEYVVIGLEERIVDLNPLNAEQRYQQLLKSNKQKIIERIPQHYITNYPGITAVRLSRIRNTMNKK